MFILSSHSSPLSLSPSSVCVYPLSVSLSVSLHPLRAVCKALLNPDSSRLWVTCCCPGPIRGVSILLLPPPLAQRTHHLPLRSCIPPQLRPLSFLPALSQSLVHPCPSKVSVSPRPAPPSPHACCCSPPNPVPSKPHTHFGVPALWGPCGQGPR